jgi:hypothetical protein
MSSLRALQQSFLKLLLPQPSTVADCIESNNGLSAEQRLSIYRRGYQLRLKEALVTDFEHLHGYLGEQQFAQLTSAYIAAHPSDSTTLRHFSRHMPVFLGATEPYQTMPVLAEIARIEQAFADSFDAEDKPYASVDDLVAIEPGHWPQMRFSCQASLQQLCFSYNSFAIWTALDRMDQHRQTEPQEAVPQPIKQQRDEHWIIWRNKELVSHYRSLSLAESEVLTMAGQGCNFEAICEVLLTHFSEEDTPLQALTYIQGWLNEGLLAGLVVD